MENPRARVLVVEDDRALLEGLADVLTFHGYRTEGACDGPEGLRLALTGAFDLVILDVMLPGLDGFSICRRLREARPGQAVIMLTAKGAEADVVAGLSAGADDYVNKPFSLRELMARVEAVLRRSGKTVAEARIAFRGLVLDSRTLEASAGGRSQPLTRREMDILFYLHRHRDRIVSKKELLTQVWRYADAGIETRTVDIHIIKLRKKIGYLDPGLDLIRTVRGEGYRWGEG